jgi:hypothetical protein
MRRAGDDRQSFVRAPQSIESHPVKTQDDVIQAANYKESGRLNETQIFSG